MVEDSRVHRRVVILSGHVLGQAGGLCHNKISAYGIVQLLQM